MKQAEILEELANGRDPRMLVRDLGISFHTFRDHRAGILRRLESQGVRSTAQAIAWAWKNGIILETDERRVSLGHLVVDGRKMVRSDYSNSPAKEVDWDQVANGAA